MFLQSLLQRKNNTFYILWVCVCNLMYPACNAQAPCCHLWPVWLDHIFPHYLINGRIFGGEKSYWTQNVFWFAPKHFSERFLILRSIQPGVTTNVYTFSSNLPSFLWFITETQTFSTDFRKILKISWKYVKRVPICSMPAGGRTDRQTRRRCSFSQFLEQT